MVESTAPVRGSTGAGSCQGAQSQNAQTHSGGCNSGNGAAGGADDGAVCAGGLSDAEAAAARLNSLEGLRETGGPPFFLPKGALTHHPEGAVVLAVGKPCALRGGLRLLRQPPDNATTPAGAAVIVCAIGQIPSLQPTLFSNRLRKPATGSFAAEMDRRSARPFSLLQKRNRKKKTR